jgi:anti-anti-sigma factor
MVCAELTAERRIEDWIAGYLDDGHSVAAHDWHERLATCSLTRRDGSNRIRSKPGALSPTGWARFRAIRRHGVTIIRLVDRSLLKDADLDELAGDLRAMIEAGHGRIVLNFAAVERMASRVAAVAAQVHRQCRMIDGGALKACGLAPGLETIFRLASPAREVQLVADEATAIDGPWPEPKALRPFPVDVLCGLIRTTERTVDIRGAALRGEDADMDLIRLVVATGSGRGRAISVSGPRFVIGRDPRCHLRPASPAVSRRHAVIERRGDRVFLRDLGSANGTTLNGRLLRRAESEVADGDRIQVGPLAFILQVGYSRAIPEEIVVGWLMGDEAAPEPDSATIDDLPAFDPAAKPWKHEVIEDVLVITPKVPDLDDGVIERLREELMVLFDGPSPRRVVVNLEYVAHLPGQAIGVLLAHHLRLDRAGGALRFCQARNRLATALEQLRLPILVDCYPTVDEAVLAVWPQPDAASR